MLRRLFYFLHCLTAVLRLFWAGSDPLVFIFLCFAPLNRAICNNGFLPLVCNPRKSHLRGDGYDPSVLVVLVAVSIFAGPMRTEHCFVSCLQCSACILILLFPLFVRPAQPDVVGHQVRGRRFRRRCRVRSILSAFHRRSDSLWDIGCTLFVHCGFSDFPPLSRRQHRKSMLNSSH